MDDNKRTATDAATTAHINNNGRGDDGGDDNDNESDMNPYLAFRAAKMARNEARLKELGLWKQQQKKSVATVSASSSSSATKTKKRKTNKQQSWELDASQRQNLQHLRRSSRVKKNQPNYAEDKISLTSSSSSSSYSISGATRTTRRSLDSDADDSVMPGDDTTTTTKPNKPTRRVSANSSTTTATTTTTVSKVRPNSVRLIRLDHNKLVETLLGRNLQVTGKDHVIHQSFKIAASPQDQTRLGYYYDQQQADVFDNDNEDNGNDDNNNIPRLSFNKYSGVQEWQTNNVIFLWVNLNNDNNNNNSNNNNPQQSSSNNNGGASGVVNEFWNDGRQITWFGGSRMDDESPIIQSLLRIGKNAQVAAAAAATTAAAKSSSSSSSNTTVEHEEAAIVLWCRRYDRETKKFSPYYCFGRMGYHSHVVGSYPVSFVWNLLDYSKLLERGGQEVRDMMMLS